MAIIIFIVIGIITFLFMELVAWFTHKYIMHGFLWVLHKDHHAPLGKKLQKNDIFSIFFALPCILLIISGLNYKMPINLSVGLGVAAYGVAYFIFHDSLVHKRLQIFKIIKSKYIKSVLSAHLAHHEGKKNFGFLFMFHKKYFNPANHAIIKRYPYQVK